MHTYVLFLSFTTGQTLNAASFMLWGCYTQSIMLTPYKYHVTYMECKMIHSASKVGNAKCIPGGQERRCTNLFYDYKGQRSRELKRSLE